MEHRRWDAHGEIKSERERKIRFGLFYYDQDCPHGRDIGPSSFSKFRVSRGAEFSVSYILDSLSFQPRIE